MTARQRRNFLHARHMAEMSDFRRARVGCVAVIGGRVIATGFSQHRTHPLQDHFNRYRDFRGQQNVAAKLHAECAMAASVRHFPIDWAKVDVYIYRVCVSRQHGIAFPCPACETMLREMGVRRIFYTTDTGYECFKVS